MKNSKHYSIENGTMDTLVLCGDPEDSDGFSDIWIPFSLELAETEAFKLSAPADAEDPTAGLTTVYTRNNSYILNIPFEEFRAAFKLDKASRGNR